MAPGSRSSVAPPVFPSPSQNPTLRALAARRRVQEEAEAEFEEVGRRGFAGRRFVDAATVRNALKVRDAGVVSDAEIERQFGLREGTVGKLGRKGILRNVD